MAMRRRTSALWDHFSETEDKKAKCNYCYQVISFASGTLGNLSRHLARRHPTISLKPVERLASLPTSVDLQSSSAPIVDLIESQNHRQTMQSKITAFAEFAKPMTIKKKTKIDEQLTIMIAKEYHPLRLVEEQEFNKFVSLLCPSYNLPSRKTISERLIPQLCLKLEHEVQCNVRKATAICLTTDAWTSKNNESFIAITAHYIDIENSKLCSNLLSCIEYNDRHTSSNLCEFLRSELLKWGIQNKVGAIVSDNAANILHAVQLGGWRSIGCFAHLLNLVVQASLQIMSATIRKAKSIVEFFKNSTQGLYKLHEIQKQMGVSELKLKQDVCTRWNSTYEMLHRIVKVKDSVIATLALVKNDLALTNEEWTEIEIMLPILKTFYEITVEISAEKNVSLSKVIVYCQLLRRSIGQHLSNMPNSTSNVRRFLETINEQIQKRFYNIEKQVLYAESTILDPRFKNKGFRDQENFKISFENLKSKLGKTHAPVELESHNKEGEVPVSSSNVGISIWDNFDRDIANLVPQNTLAAGIVELQKYIAEPIIGRMEDPLLWWNARKSVYPILHAHVLKRLNLVATSVPCERVFSKAGLIRTDNRSRLSAKKVSQLIFINSNLASC